MLSTIFEQPLYIWEGYKNVNVNFFTKIGFKSVGNATNNNKLEKWNSKYIIGINNTQKTYKIPDSYLKITLPIDPNTHNAIFIQTTTKIDKWSSINMCICDPNNNLPNVKIQTRTNNNNGPSESAINSSYGNSSFLGPFNEIAHIGNNIGSFEWLQFCIPKQFIDKYKNDKNEITITINNGINPNGNILYISGIASCPNPYGVCTLSAIDLGWATNNGSTVIWQGEAFSEFESETITDIRIPIASLDKAVYIVHIDHGDSSYGSNPRIYVPNYSNNKYWYLSPVNIGRLGMIIKGRTQFREARGIYLSADIVKKAAIVEPETGALQITIRINTKNIINVFRTRGWYSEQVEALSILPFQQIINIPDGLIEEVTEEVVEEEPVGTKVGTVVTNIGLKDGTVVTNIGTKDGTVVTNNGSNNGTNIIIQSDKNSVTNADNQNTINKLTADLAEANNTYNNAEKILNEIKLYNDTNKVTEENINNQKNAQTQFDNAKILKDKLNEELNRATAVNQANNPVNQATATNTDNQATANNSDNQVTATNLAAEKTANNPDNQATATNLAAEKTAS